jgi:CheY-specific phosphatase CheX
MITEESYKNALEIIKAYRKQQNNIRLEIEEQERKLQVQRFKELNITGDTDVVDIVGHISSTLFHILRDNSRRLSQLRGMTKKKLSQYDRVGKKTVNEFVNLMAAAGYTIL